MRLILALAILAFGLAVLVVNHDSGRSFGIANEDAHSALSDAHATAILLGRLLEADPKWPGFQRRLDAAGAAAEQWPTFATLPKKEWLPRGTHLA